MTTVGRTYLYQGSIWICLLTTEKPLCCYLQTVMSQALLLTAGASGAKNYNLRRT